ncbi:MAG: flavodoxin family protein [Actinomycetota bacterium]|nr:flavodoxin family protein [Actinomycetota bacterium]
MIPEVRMLGICASPVKEGNAQAFLERALASQDGIAGVNYEIINLAGMDIRDCIHCNFCLKKQEGERRCSIQDDLAEIYPMLEAADVLLLATPVYFGRLSGHMAAFLDRMRVYVHGNLTAGRLRDKVGGSMAVAWFRFAGLEMALLSMNQFFYAVNMVIASPELGLQGGSAFSSLEGTGRREGEDKKLVLKDDLGIASAVSTVSRAVELARVIKAGRQSLHRT